MSYCRFTGSDAYIFMHADGYLCCCACYLNYADDCNFHSTKDMVEHIKQHREHGDYIPSYVEDDLWRDDKENFPNAVHEIPNDEPTGWPNDWPPATAYGLGGAM